MPHSFVAPRKILNELVRILGLEGKPIRSIVIRASIDKAATIEVEEVVDDHFYKRLKIAKVIDQGEPD